MNLPESPDEARARRALETLSGRLVSRETYEAAEEATQARITGLQMEIDTQRMLTRYARRTWFEVLFWVFLATAHIKDLASSYQHDAWSLIFWMTPGDVNGSPWWMHLVGFLWQATALLVLAKRSQVPPWLLTRVPHGAMDPEDFEKKYGVQVRRPDVRPKWKLGRKS